MANTIETIMGAKGTPTLKALAEVFEIQAVRLYAIAKQPKAGEVYDAHVYNWDAIERFINRRLDADKGLGTLEDVIAAALLKDEELKASDKRSSRAGTGAKIEFIKVDGKDVQKRKYPNFNKESGKPFCRRKDPNVYDMIFQTESHTVLRALNADGTYASEEMSVISNNMMNYQGVADVNIDQAIKDRFEKTGEFAVKVEAPAETAAKATK